MAIVVDKSGNATASLIGQTAAGTDRPYCTPNRTNAGTPNAALTPQYAGERVWDTTNFLMYEAWGLANNQWQTVSDFEHAGA